MVARVELLFSYARLIFSQRGSVMLHRVINKLLMILTLVSCVNLHAAPGPLVTIIGTGGEGDLDVNVWLNGYSPLSGQRFHVIGGHTLTITPTHPIHYYPAIGVEVVTPGKSVIAGCSQYVGDRCLLPASNAAPATVTVSSGMPQCLGTANACRAFVTELRITGNIQNDRPTHQTGAETACPPGGNITDRANCLCQYDATNYQGLTAGSYKAWISTGAQNAINNIHYTATVAAKLPYVRPDGTVIAAAGQLPTPPLLHSVGTVNLAVWTGTTAAGVLDNTATCTNWTSSTLEGVIGNPLVTTPYWTDEGPVTCAGNQPLYCFEAPQ